MSLEYKLPQKNASVKINAVEIKKPEAIMAQYVNANIQCNSLLDTEHAQISSLKLNIADSSGIILSGGALKKLPK